MEIKVVLILFLLEIVLVNAHLHLNWDTRNPAFDPQLYEEALDPEQCQAQLDYLTTNNLLLRLTFLDAGLRIPRGMLMLNTLDMGHFRQCLGINEELEDMHIKGKYCTVRSNIALNSEILDITNRVHIDPNKLRMSDDIEKKVEQYEAMLRGAKTFTGATDVTDINSRVPGGGIIDGIGINLAVCIPKPCTTTEGINGLLLNLTALGLQFQEETCRFSDDKPWVPADYVAVVIFSIIGLLTLLSTSYDLWKSVIHKKDTKEISVVHRSFSVYTNGRRLTTFSKNPGSLECLDGIRALAMMWVIVGHTFSTAPLPMNILDLLSWIQSLNSLWLISTPITVDTFFMLSGLLLVYTTTGKLTSMKLLKNLHYFYLNRLLRMFPLLATAVLLQASVFHRIADGPLWEEVATATNNCRTYWWSTLLYIQNYVNPRSMCHPHTWYLAIDTQLYILSPIVLLWVLSGRRMMAWYALLAGVLISLTASTIYVFIKELPGSVLVFARLSEERDYMVYFYYNTLTRASPFFVGMMFGYVLYVFRGKELKMPWVLVMVLWASTLALMGALLYATYPMLFFDYDNQILDSSVNAFQRPLWAACLGWLVFACVHGYGGPVNWLLSLSLWKLPSRISYGIYLFHYPIQLIINGTILAPIFFTQTNIIYQFLAHLFIAFIVSFVLTLLIDSPFSTLFKLLLGGGPKKPLKENAVSGAGNEDLTAAKDGVDNLAFHETETERIVEPPIDYDQKTDLVLQESENDRIIEPAIDYDQKN